jgi:transcriptional regulator with XRE-family HTH domain
MAQPEDDLASRIRTARTGRGWSLSELAAASGVSKAMISRVERGESSPTASLLGKLSGALEVSMSALLAAAQPRSGWTDPATGYRRVAITTTNDFAVDMTEVVLPPRATQSFPASAYAFNRHVIWVADGELTFTEGATRHVLAASEALRLGVPADCTFANETDVPCRYLVVLAPGRH